jgi:hypothetical protein
MFIYDYCPKPLRRLRSGGLRFQATVGKICCETPSNGKKLGMVACTCHPSDSGKSKIREFGPVWAKKQELITKITQAKRTRGLEQVVEHLLSRAKP